MNNFKDPYGMTKEEIWEAIAALERTDPIVHAVTRTGHRLKLDREHVALALSFVLLQQLQATREEFQEWICSTPRPVNVNPGPEFLRCLMSVKGN